MDYNILKMCRVCLEEGAVTSIYSTEFAMIPANMMMMCAKIRVYKTDGLPAVICNNCIYRLGVAYHFKQQCENSDIRLRQYLGLQDRGYYFCDAETNTDRITEKPRFVEAEDIDNSDDEDRGVGAKKSKRRSRYQRKAPEEHKKRGPKPLPKLPQECYECQKTFKCAAQLAMHMRTHSGEKPFACLYCPRKFAQKYNLRIHERTHTKERPYQCEICSKQFSALGNFQAHQKIHTGVRDHMCPVCQKAFYNAGDLTKHMATHTGIKNNHCDVCGKAFSRHRDMQAHKRKLHAMAALQERTGSEEDDDDEEEVDSATTSRTAVVAATAIDPITTTDTAAPTIVNDNFKCPDCDKEFSTAGSLSVHFRTHGSSSNMLSLPLVSGQMHVPPPPPHPHAAHYHHPHSHAAHHHHPHAQAPPSPSATLVHDSLHPHAHHLPLGTPLQIQTNHSHSHPHSHTGMTMTHNPIAHMLGPPPPPPPPSEQSTLVMMHAGQRLHPY